MWPNCVPHESSFALRAVNTSKYYENLIYLYFPHSSLAALTHLTFCGKTVSSHLNGCSRKCPLYRTPEAAI